MRSTRSQILSVWWDGGPWRRRAWVFNAGKHLAQNEFTSRKFADGEHISLGDVQLEIRHTPGHTPESISIVVWERASDAEPYGVLTGDTLFIGDVGRPDPSSGWQDNSGFL